MKKTRAVKKQKKICGTAYELLSMMTIISCLAIERHFTSHAKTRSTILDICAEKDNPGDLRGAFSHNKDLRILARNFGTFIRVAKKVAREV
ncbi:MAG: hypothetical protein A2036_03935 [Omnitrophica bacterium GWA2_50_21]|nr:MAG: hypothetical protein A2036_03935 [Omnitrophica bacterium GWA2_50_21]